MQTSQREIRHSPRRTGAKAPDLLPGNLHTLASIEHDRDLAAISTGHQAVRLARLLEREVDTAAIKQLMPLARGEASLSELQIPPKYRLNGITLSELRLPEESVIVSVSRDGRLIIPRGNTQIFSGDKILVVCANSAVRELSRKMGIETEDKK